MICFLDFQVTKEVPKKIQYLEIERQVVAHVPNQNQKMSEF